MHKLWHIYLNAFAAKGHLQNGNIFSLNYIIRLFFFENLEQCFWRHEKWRPKLKSQVLVFCFGNLFGHEA